MVTALDEPQKKRNASRSPSRKANGRQSGRGDVARSYKSEGVTDHDIFDLPSSDWQLLGLITLVGAVVRLWKIWQPSSVVFDEVQQVQPDLIQRNPY